MKKLILPGIVIGIIAVWVAFMPLSLLYYKMQYALYYFTPQTTVTCPTQPVVLQFKPYKHIPEHSEKIAGSVVAYNQKTQQVAFVLEHTNDDIQTTITEIMGTKGILGEDHVQLLRGITHAAFNQEGSAIFTVSAAVAKAWDACTGKELIKIEKRFNNEKEAFAALEQVLANKQNK